MVNVWQECLVLQMFVGWYYPGWGGEVGGLFHQSDLWLLSHLYWYDKLTKGRVIQPYNISIPRNIEKPWAPWYIKDNAVECKGGLNFHNWPMLWRTHSQVWQEIINRLLNSLVAECWLWGREVAGSIPSQGPRHTTDVMQWYQCFPCLALNIKRETLCFLKK